MKFFQHFNCTDGISNGDPKNGSTQLSWSFKVQKFEYALENGFGYFTARSIFY